MNAIKGYLHRLLKEDRLLNDEYTALVALVETLEFSPMLEEDRLSAFQQAVKETYGVDPLAPEPFSVIRYCRQSVVEWVTDGWTEENWYDVPRRLTYADAQYNLRAAIEEGYDIPIGITAAAYMNYWNIQCDAHAPTPEFLESMRNNN